MKTKRNTPLLGSWRKVGKIDNDRFESTQMMTAVWPRVSFNVGVFVLAGATLALEIVHTRILSVVAWYYLAFFVISVAMLGLTAGAVWVYLRGERFSAQTLSFDLAHLAAAFGVSSAAALAVQTTLVPTFVMSASAMLAIAQLTICLATPYFSPAQR